MTKKKYMSPVFNLTVPSPTEPYKPSEDITGSDPIGGTTYSFGDGFTPDMLTQIEALPDAELAEIDTDHNSVITVDEYNQ